MKTLSLGLHGAVIPQADLKLGLKAAALAGFKFYEPEIAKVLEYNLSEREEANILRKELGITWLPLNEITVFCKDPNYSVKKILSLAASLSINTVTLIPEISKKNDISFNGAVKELKQVVSMAANNGISLMYEMLCFKERLFYHFEDSLNLVQEVGIPFVLDIFHFIVGGVTVEKLASLSPELIGIVHITDAITAGKSINELKDQDRVLPGEGGLPIVKYMKAIRQTGYRGPMSIEVFHPKYATQDPYKIAIEARRRAKDLLKVSGWLNDNEIGGEDL